VIRAAIRRRPVTAVVARGPDVVVAALRSTAVARARTTVRVAAARRATCPAIGRTIATGATAIAAMPVAAAAMVVIEVTRRWPIPTITMAVAVVDPDRGYADIAAVIAIVAIGRAVIRRGSDVLGFGVADICTATTTPHIAIARIDITPAQASQRKRQQADPAYDVHR
jgi:hypothetical protein